MDRKYLYGAGLLIIVIALMLPMVSVSYTIDVAGKVLPAKEWVLSREADGQLMATLQDNLKGIVANYSVTRLERGDATSFNLNPSIQNGSFVQIGDTISSVVSYELERQLARLRGDLESERALLRSLSTGEKASIITDARQRLAQATRRRDQQQTIVDRLAEQVKTDLVSRQEYEIAVSDLELDEISVLRAASRLETVATGARAVDIEVVRTRIRADEGELRALNAMKENLVLTSPIDGMVLRQFASDTLLVIADTSGSAFIFPVSIEERGFVPDDAFISVLMPNLEEPIKGEIVQFSTQVKMIGRGQYYIATADLNINLTELSPGLVASASIYTGTVSLWTQLMRNLKKSL